MKATGESTIVPRPDIVNERLEPIESEESWESLKMSDDRNRERKDESRRILERVSREAESGGRSVVDRAAQRARDHVTATDVDRDDWAEYWGTRIGRTLGALLLVGLIVWLVLYLAQGE
jgi:hypothetical protein